MRGGIARAGVGMACFAMGMMLPARVAEFADKLDAHRIANVKIILGELTIA